MTKRTMPLRSARAAVAAMPELSGAKTPRSRSRALQVTRTRERGDVEMRFPVDPDTRARVEWLRQQPGLRRTQDIFARAVTTLQREIDIARQMSAAGQRDLDFLSASAAKAVPDVLDFCIRFTAAALRKAGEVSID